MHLGNCFVCKDYKMIHCRKACKKCYQRLNDKGKLDLLPEASGVRVSIPRKRTGKFTTP